jgi:DNA-binding Xre family transcriptional regulator
MLNKNLLKSAMARAGFTQGALASRIGMSENTLSSRMTGASPFNIDEVDVICEVLDIESNDEKAAIFLAASSQKRDTAPA